MKEEELRSGIERCLHRVAPEADLETLDRDAPLQQEIELDSLDFLRFMRELGTLFKVEIPERDYEQVATFNKCITYLLEKGGD